MPRIDLHCHYIPGVDDGVRTLDESQRLLAGLKSLGYGTVIATPHIRDGMFENRRDGLERAFLELDELLGGNALAETRGLPERGLSAEHHLDDVFLDLLARGEVLPYPGGRAILIEFNDEVWPRRVEKRIFELMLRNLRPVIAHPERCRELEHETDALDPLLAAGACTLLDVMSLVGRYGGRARRTAERMLEEGAYDAACTDSHKPEDVDLVGKSITRLVELVGDDDAESLLEHTPRALLDGTYDP